MIIFATSEQYSDDRALDAGVVYPMLNIPMINGVPSLEHTMKHTYYYGGTGGMSANKKNGWHSMPKKLT